MIQFEVEIEQNWVVETLSLIITATKYLKGSFVLVVVFLKFNSLNHVICSSLADIYVLFTFK